MRLHQFVVTFCCCCVRFVLVQKAKGIFSLKQFFSARFPSVLVLGSVRFMWAVQIPYNFWIFSPNGRILLLASPRRLRRPVALPLVALVWLSLLFI